MPVPSAKTKRTAAITGGGSGLGRDIALELATKVYTVFGTAISAAEVDDLRQASSGRVSLAVCDIASEHAVRGWADSVSGAIGDAAFRRERFSACVEEGTWSYRAGQHLDRQPAASVQRSFRCFKGGDGGVRRRLQG